MSDTDNNKQCCDCLEKEIINNMYLYKGKYFCAGCLIQALADDSIITLDCENMDNVGIKVN